MNRKILIGIGALVLIGVIWFFSSSSIDENFYHTVEKGNLEITIKTSGELEAKSSVPILGPSGLRAFRIWQIKIEDLIDEGSVVEKGDYVGALDKSQIVDKYSEEQSNLLKIEAQYTQTRLDTTLELSQVRNEIQTAKYALREAEITLKQSKYEPPAIIRQAELSLEKAKKSLIDTRERYKVKKEQAQAKMQEVNVNRGIALRKIEQIETLIDELKVTAPENGMVIYERDWDGQKKGPGSMMNTWNPKIASLPDLSTMVSKTFINEVEISKIKKGQKVNLGLDAFPDKKLKGEVKNISNVGQQNPNSDGKVFEVTIEIFTKDSTLRPAMTTSNEIIINKYEAILSVPLEGVFNQGDTLNYVLLKSGLSGMVRKEVKLGESNENFVIVSRGLKEGEEIILNAPEGREDIEIEHLN